MSKKKKLKKIEKANKKNSLGFIGKAMNYTDPNRTRELLYKFKDVNIPINVLLTSPNIESDLDGEPDVKPGKHHSKSFISNVGKIIHDNKILRHYVSLITATDYDSNFRGKIKICQIENFPNQYHVIFYDKRGDEGFGVKILFIPKEKWQIILLAKILKNKIRLLGDYSIIIK